MDRRRKLLVNNYEKLADELITKAVTPYNARICPKVGLKDIVRISGSGISIEEYSYALKAHIDFCVVNSDDYVEFGLEIDESHHLSDPKVIKKDRLKDKLCSKLGFPLLRISDKSLERVAELELLAWLTSYYFVFSDLSKSGKDLREPENQRKLLLLREPFVYSPFADSHESIQSFERAGLFEAVSHELPACVSHNSETYFISWAGVPLKNSGIFTGSKPFLYSKKAFRAFNNFAGIYPFQLSEGLALVELDRKIRDYINGFYRPRENETLDTMSKEIAEEYFKIEKLRKLRG
jgi:hypothetical protein